MKRTPWVVTAVVVGCVLVSGCGPTTASDRTTGATQSQTATTSSGPTLADRTSHATNAVLAYATALNAVDFTQPATFEAVYETVTGDQLTFEKGFLTGFADKGWTSTGDSAFTLLEPSGDSDFVSSGSFTACLDLRERRYFDNEGVEWVDTSSSGFQAQSINVTSADGGESWLIAKIEPREGDPACA